MPDDDVLADRYEQADATLRRRRLRLVRGVELGHAATPPAAGTTSCTGPTRTGGASARARTATSAGCAGGTSSTRPPTPTGSPPAQSPAQDAELLDDADRALETIMLGLRLREGLPLTALSTTGRRRAADAVGAGPARAGRARRRPRRPHRSRPAARRRRRSATSRTDPPLPLAGAAPGRRRTPGPSGERTHGTVRRAAAHRAAGPGAGTSPRSTGSWARFEFPWDMNQALSFALFRTYAVPSIGDLLARTGEFTARDAEALRRHRADPRRGRSSTGRQPRGPDGDPPDEPDAPLLRHQQRRPALRAGHVRGDADPLDRRLRLAADDGDRADGERQLLPRARPAHGHPGHPARPGRRSPGCSTPTSGSTSASTRAGEPSPRRRWRCWRRSRQRPARRPRWSAGCPSRPWTTRCCDAFRFPHPSRLVRALVRAGSRPAAGSCGCCRPAPSRSSPGSCRRSAAIRTATRSPSSAPSRPAARCRTPRRGHPAVPPRRPDGPADAPGAWRFLPGLYRLRRYERAWLRGDLLAGVRRRGLPDPAGHGLRGGGRAAADRRPLGDRRWRCLLRPARLVAAALGRARSRPRH